jgi:hypothetical protein
VLPFLGSTQNIDYTKKIIDTLTSSYFGGRGAVDLGEKKAADFLKNEFKRNNLQSFNDSFFQHFRYNINTFPGKVSVSIDGKKLITGVDYLVEPHSGAVGGNFQLIWYNKRNVPTKKEFKKLVAMNFFHDKFIVIDDEGVGKNDETFQQLKLNFFGAAGIINLEPKKLTHYLSQTYNDFGVLRIMKNKISHKSRKITVEIDQKFERNYPSQNVIGFVKGEVYPDSFIVVSAHYDHLGYMGKEVYFPGANDNASGVAMLLNLAYHYTHKELPKKSIVFMLFGAEEVAILGSKHYVENPLFPLEQVNFVMNLDLLGTGEEGAMVVNATVFPTQFKKLETINNTEAYLPVIKKRGKAANSDHYWFTEKGIPSFFLYTLGGISAYHDVEDISLTLPLTKFEDCFRLLRDFLDEL